MLDDAKTYWAKMPVHPLLIELYSSYDIDSDNLVATLTEDDCGLSIDSASTSSDTVELGSTISSTATITIYAESGKVNSIDPTIVKSIFVKIGNDETYQKCFRFFATDYSTSDGDLIIDASDILYFLDVNIAEVDGLEEALENTKGDTLLTACQVAVTWTLIKRVSEELMLEEFVKVESDVTSPTFSGTPTQCTTVLDLFKYASAVTCTYVSSYASNTSPYGIVINIGSWYEDYYNTSDDASIVSLYADERYSSDVSRTQLSIIGVRNGSGIINYSTDTADDTHVVIDVSDVLYDESPSEGFSPRTYLPFTMQIPSAPYLFRTGGGFPSCRIYNLGSEYDSFKTTDGYIDSIITAIHYEHHGKTTIQAVGSVESYKKQTSSSGLDYSQTQAVSDMVSEETGLYIKETDEGLKIGNLNNSEYPIYTLIKDDGYYIMDEDGTELAEFTSDSIQIGNASSSSSVNLSNLFKFYADDDTGMIEGSANTTNLSLYASNDPEGGYMNLTDRGALELVQRPEVFDYPKKRFVLCRNGASDGYAYGVFDDDIVKIGRLSTTKKTFSANTNYYLSITKFYIPDGYIPVCISRIWALDDSTKSIDVAQYGINDDCDTLMIRLRNNSSSSVSTRIYIRFICLKCSDINTFTLAADDDDFTFTETWS